MNLSGVNKSLRYCIIIPTYNNQATLSRVIDGVLKFRNGGNIIVVNDGSTDNTSSILSSYEKDILVIKNETNRGKGLSLRKAFNKAIEMGYEHAITIDSDGQHFPEDIPLFIEAAEKDPGALIMGSRDMSQEGVPGKSSFGNKFSNFWFKVETGITLPDTQTGFRLYPLTPISSTRLFTSKFETEIEVIVKLAWKNVKIIPIPVQVLYDRNERVSHFRPFKDFFRISLLNTYLVTLAILYYIPIRFMKAIKDETVKADESNLRKSASIGFGVFMGIVPIWGFQLLVGIPLSFLLKLNKVLFIASANISVPPLIPLIIYLSYLCGGPFVNNDITINSLDSVTLASIHLNVVQYVIGAFILAITLGLITFASSFLIFILFRPNNPVKA